MARFDVHANPDGGGYLLDVQADLLAGLNTRLVVPLMPADRALPPAARLNPVLAAAVPCRLLGGPLASLRHEDLPIGNAMDMLLTGI